MPAEGSPCSLGPEHTTHPATTSVGQVHRVRVDKRTSQLHAAEAAQGLLDALAKSGALVAAPVATAKVIGRTFEAPKLAAEQVTKAAVAAGVLPALAAVAVAEQAMREWLQDMTVAIDKHLTQANPDLTQLVDWLSTLWPKEGREFTDSLAVSVAQAAVAGARDNAAEVLVPVVDDAAPLPGRVERTWTTRGDERVRAAHQEAAGQVRPVGAMFDVGGFQLRYPSDPMAPASVARNCRCWVVYSWPTDAKFTIPNV